MAYYAGKIPSRQAIDQAIIVHGLRIRSTPAEFACIIFETARQIDEMVEEEKSRRRISVTDQPLGGGMHTGMCGGEARRPRL